MLKASPSLPKRRDGNAEGGAAAGGAAGGGDAGGAAAAADGAADCGGGGGGGGCGGAAEGRSAAAAAPQRQSGHGMEEARGGAGRVRRSGAVVGRASERAGGVFEVKSTTRTFFGRATRSASDSQSSRTARGAVSRRLIV